MRLYARCKGARCKRKSDFSDGEWGISTNVDEHPRMAGGEAEEDWLRMEVDAEFVQTAIT